MSAVTNPDPKEAANYRFAKGAVIILTALIVVAVVALIVGFAMRGRSEGSAPRGQAVGITLPAGAVIERMDETPGRLIVLVRSGKSETIYIIDTTDGRLVSQMKASGGP